MAKFRVWIEDTRAKNFRVRSRYPDGTNGKPISVDKTDHAIIDGKDYAGKGLANKYRDQMLQKYHRGELGEAEKNVLIGPLIDKFIGECESNNLSEHTTMLYRNSLKHFVVSQHVQFIDELGEPDARDIITAWKAAEIGAGKKSGTVRTYLAGLRVFLEWLVINRHIKVNPFGKKMLPKNKDPEPKYYTTEEFLALDKACIDNDAFRIFINLCHSTGARKQEATQLRWDDIRWLEDGTAEILFRKEIVKGKTKSRTLPLDPGMVSLLGSRKSGFLVDLPVLHPGDEKMELKSRLGRLQDFFEVVHQKAGIKATLTIHGLRHTFAKNMLQKGDSNLKAVQDLLGHSSIATTEIYSQFEKSYHAEGVRKAYEARLRDEALLEAEPKEKQIIKEL